MLALARRITTLAIFAAVTVPLRAAGGETPVIPVGLDAYRMWERWPYQRIGERAYMRSTYDRRGRNEGADASHFLYQAADDFNVTLDVEGPGVLYFARYNHWHGSPWHYEVDGEDHIVQETSTADPLNPAENSVFLPETLFPNPLTWTWSITKGADLMWVPIGFEKSFRMAYSRTRYGTGYYIYKQYAPGANLSRPIVAWDAKTPPGRDVLELIARAGGDLAPSSAATRAGEATLPAKGVSEIARLETGPAMLRALEFSVPKEQAIEFGRARLGVTWDGRGQPSIDAPVAVFFGSGSLFNRDKREYLVKAFPMNIRFDDKRVYLACYFPMPFFRDARIELISDGESPIEGVRWRFRLEPFEGPSNHVGYFHATYRDHASPKLGEDLVLLDTRREEGSRDWSGSFVGTSFIFSHDAVLWTLEGDPRFFFDDSQTPQAYGTGTEEWGGGGDYWGGRNMTLPFAGHPVGARSAEAALNDEDKIESAYRFLLADLMPFGRNAVIRLEHGGDNESAEHYETVTYWYGTPSASLIPTDELKIGELASENAHDYVSPDASEPYELVSRYEWGPDTISRGRRREVLSGEGREVYPASSDWGRYTKGASEFTLKIAPENHGVLLRRKLDYGFPNQRAEVFVADPEADSHAWKRAGVWYLAGSNTTVYSNPEGELGKTVHQAQTSNRRFRDDEFLISPNLTRGKRSIRIRVQFAPVDRPLYPGHRGQQEVGWSEMKYTAYSYVMPTPVSLGAK